MMYSFGNAAAPTTRVTQYFDIAENVGIYHDGWVAATTPLTGQGMIAGSHSSDLEDRHWELYHITEDYSEAVDLADKEPKKLRELQDLFWVEAARNHVLPIHRETFIKRDEHARGTEEFHLLSRRGAGPRGGDAVFQNHSFEIAATVDIPQSGADGMLITQGGRFGGFGLYLLNGKLVYHYNFFNMAQSEVVFAGSDPGRQACADGQLQI